MKTARRWLSWTTSRSGPLGLALMLMVPGCCCLHNECRTDCEPHPWRVPSLGGVCVELGVKFVPIPLPFPHVRPKLLPSTLCAPITVCEPDCYEEAQPLVPIPTKTSASARHAKGVQRAMAVMDPAPVAPAR